MNETYPEDVHDWADDDQFHDSAGGFWRLNEGGNYCRYEDGSPPDGVVFYRDGCWRALSSIYSEARLVRGSWVDAEEAAEHLVSAEAEGPTSDRWAPPNTTGWLAFQTHERRPARLLAQARWLGVVGTPVQAGSLRAVSAVMGCLCRAGRARDERAWQALAPERPGRHERRGCGVGAAD